jgi:hypothetical protein
MAFAQDRTRSDATANSAIQLLSRMLDAVIILTARALYRSGPRINASRMTSAQTMS